MKKIISCCIACIIILSCFNVVMAEKQISDAISVDNMLQLIDGQNFSNTTQIDDIKNYINHFLYTSNFSAINGGRFNYPNSGSYVSTISDGTYSKSDINAKGCYAYAKFVTSVIYGNNGKRKYHSESAKHLTGNGLKTFLKSEAQAGEHLRIDNKHSVIYISGDDEGFYYLEYWESGTKIVLTYITYSDFAKKYNNVSSSYDSSIWLYNANTNINISTNTNSSHTHTYKADTEKCENCGEKFVRSYKNINKTYKVIKKDTAFRSQPYSAYGKIYKNLKIGTKVTVKRSFKNIHGNTWYEVSYGNNTGYIYSENLTEIVEDKESTLSINMTSYPSSINQGSIYGLRGNITSNHNITEVVGYIINLSGSTVMSSKDTPNSKSINVKSANLNNRLMFNNLSEGYYTLKIVAVDSSGNSKEWSSGFSVNGSKGVGSNTRTGVVNIPSSWENLSIRSGPGTSYKILGSMNNGEICTVYTDKTNNGWYYVNYNGITGYVSGKQINLL